MDIGAELALQVFSTAKKVPMEQKEPRLFDEAQSILYKEPLPYTWQDFINNTLNLKTKAKLNYHVIVCFVLFLYFFFFRKCRKAILGCLSLTTWVRRSYFKAYPTFFQLVIPEIGIILHKKCARAMFLHELKSMRKRTNARNKQVSFMIGIINSE